MPTTTNGLSLDSKGNLVAAEVHNGRITRVENGALRELVSTYPAGGAAAGGRRFNAPSDIAIDSLDRIYFTDTRWGSATTDVGMLVPNAAYRIGADGALAQIYVAGSDPSLTSVSGIAVSVDGSWLYLTNDVQNKLWKLQLDGDGLVPLGAIPIMLADKSKIAGDRFLTPDGITFDDNGNLYVALNDHRLSSVAVLDSDGMYKGRYDVPLGPDVDPSTGQRLAPERRGVSNISFGGADRKTLFITTAHAIWKPVTVGPGQRNSKTRATDRMSDPGKPGSRDSGRP